MLEKACPVLSVSQVANLSSSAVSVCVSYEFHSFLAGWPLGPLLPFQCIHMCLQDKATAETLTLHVSIRIKSIDLP